MIFHYHTGSITGRADSLTGELSEAFLQINPSDAGRLRIHDGERVVASSRRGKIGVNCSGILAPVPHIEMLEALGVDPYLLEWEDIEAENLILRFHDGNERTFALDELERRGLGRRSNCRRCEIPVPRMADLACGKWGLERGERDGTVIEVCSVDIPLSKLAHNLSKVASSLFRYHPGEDRDAPLPYSDIPEDERRSQSPDLQHPEAVGRTNSSVSVIVSFS